MLRWGYEGVTKGYKGNQPPITVPRAPRQRQAKLAPASFIRRLSFGLVHSTPSPSQVWAGPDSTEGAEERDNISRSSQPIGCAKGQMRLCGAPKIMLDESGLTLLKFGTG